jgi:hypothetical protein
MHLLREAFFAISQHQWLFTQNNARLFSVDVYRTNVLFSTKTLNTFSKENGNPKSAMCQYFLR